MEQLKYSKSLKAAWTGIANDPVQDRTFLLSSLWKDQQPWALKSSLGAAHLTEVQRQLQQGWAQPLAPPLWLTQRPPSVLALAEWTCPTPWAKGLRVSHRERLAGLWYNHRGHVTDISLSLSSSPWSCPTARAEQIETAASYLWDSTAFFTSWIVMRPQGKCLFLWAENKHLLPASTKTTQKCKCWLEGGLQSHLHREWILWLPVILWCCPRKTEQESKKSCQPLWTAFGEQPASVPLPSRKTSSIPSSFQEALINQKQRGNERFSPMPPALLLLLSSPSPPTSAVAPQKRQCYSTFEER